MKNSQPQTKFTGSYKKKSVYQVIFRFVFTLFVCVCVCVFVCFMLIGVDIN